MGRSDAPCDGTELNLISYLGKAPNKGCASTFLGCARTTTLSKADMARSVRVLLTGLDKGGNLARGWVEGFRR